MKQWFPAASRPAPATASFPNRVLAHLAESIGVLANSFEQDHALT